MVLSNVVAAIPFQGNSVGGKAATVPHYTSFHFNNLYGCRDTNMEVILLEHTVYNKRNKMPSTQLVYVTSLMWKQVSTSKGGGIKYIKEMYKTIIMLITGISILQIY
jgi:hypothetical protein